MDTNTEKALEQVKEAIKDIKLSSNKSGTVYIEIIEGKIQVRAQVKIDYKSA